VLESVEGATRFSQKGRIFGLRTRFNFCPSTTHPIRKHIRTQSDGVQWSNVVCVPGTRTMTAIANGSVFKDASAEVVLFGWRKEIHAAKIAELKKDIDALTLRIAAQEDTLGRIFEEIIGLRLERNALGLELKVCSRDMDKVGMERRKSPPLGSLAGTEHGVERSESSQSPVEGALLDAGSISGYASLLGLKSRIAAKALPAWAVAAINDCESEVRSAKKMMDSYYSRYEWAISMGTRATLGNIDRILRTAVDTGLSGARLRFTDMRQNANSTSRNSDDELAALNKECRLDADKLASQFGGDFGREIRELERKLANMPDGPTRAKNAPDMNLKKTALDSQVAVLDRACSLVRADKQEVGVAAALDGSWYQGRLVEAFFSIYRGEKLREGLSPEARPLKAQT